MRNIVGNPARKDDFFKREGEIEKIKDRIENGNNLQIAAPRRVGKTSILFYLYDNDIDGHVYVYIDTERVDNEQAFYKKLLKEIIKQEPIAQSTQLRALLEKGERFFKKIKSIKVAGQGIDFHEQTDQPDYYEELVNFLSGFELEGGRKLVLMIDEFPQTILNIVDSSKGDTKPAIQFLQSNRELRLNPDINQRVRFIYTGSIGLNHTVANINATAFVNDLNSVEVEPLSVEEALVFVKELLSNKQVDINQAATQYLLKKISWLIPFHIQLAVHEIIMLCHKNKIAKIEVVDQAFDNMVSSRNNNHFEHYYSRLKSQFKNEAFQYADAILQSLAIKGTIGEAELYDSAVKYNVADQYRQILQLLVYDGYINNVGDPSTYRFNSSIVQLWWQRFICK
jgi:uncharacterized protein